MVLISCAVTAPLVSHNHIVGFLIQGLAYWFMGTEKRDTFEIKFTASIIQTKCMWEEQT